MSQLMKRPVSVRLLLGLLLPAGVALSVCLYFRPATRRSDADFIPSDIVCRRALSSALQAWQAGVPVGPVPQSTPLIHVTDSSRIEQRPLQSWRILGQVPGNAPSCYAVQLTLDHPVEQRRERYVVVGIDPLWVFRHEDYDLLLHWEHPMKPGSAATGDSEEPTP
jgi:hypothetical protein